MSNENETAMEIARPTNGIARHGFGTHEIEHRPRAHPDRAAECVAEGAVGERKEPSVNSPRFKFWMVWSPQGGTPPRVRHHSRDAAVKAAEDMARLHPNQEFYVMQAVSKSQSVTVQTTTLDDEELPF